MTSITNLSFNVLDQKLTNVRSQIKKKKRKNMYAFKLKAKMGYFLKLCLSYGQKMK